MDHLADKYFSEGQKAFKKNGKHLNFEDMMDFIRDWIMVLQSKGVSYNHQSAKVAALELEAPVEKGGQRPHPSQSKQGPKNGGPSWARRTSPTRSPPKVQPRCNICAKYHETAQCLKLAPMSAEERARELMRKKICFACLQPGHRKLECPHPPLSACTVARTTTQFCTREGSMTQDRSHRDPRRDQEQEVLRLLRTRL